MSTTAVETRKLGMSWVGRVAFKLLCGNTFDQRHCIAIGVTSGRFMGVLSGILGLCTLPSKLSSTFAGLMSQCA
eukprot:3732692-Pyramimonas_sp.AAC.1